MNLSLIRMIFALILALSVTACTSTTTTYLFKGEMHLNKVSGSECFANGAPPARVPVELALEYGKSADGQMLMGYFNGTGIQPGMIIGNSPGKLMVVYPGTTNAAEMGHTMALSPYPGGMNGELREKPQKDSETCYFEKATLEMKQVEGQNIAREGFELLAKRYSAKELFSNGQALLKDNKPEQALPVLTKCLEVRSELDPNKDDKLYPALAIAVAHAMAGREEKALSVVRKLFTANKPESDPAKQRLIIGRGICSYAVDAAGGQSQKSALAILDTMVKEFGSTTGLEVVAAECYQTLGKASKEKEAYGQAIEFYRKTVILNPGDADSINEVMTSYVANEAPSEARRYLQEHSKEYIAKSNQKGYENLLSLLYFLEGIIAERSGNMVLAEQQFREAAKLDAKDQRYNIFHAKVLLKLTKLAEARNVLENAIKTCTDDDCRKAYTDELNRQNLVEKMVKKLEP